MKASTIFTAALIFSVSVFCSQVSAQSSGIAADKKKQENLEKNKAHQKEMQKKYNALSPQEKAAAEKKANDYKKSGGKTTTGKGTSTGKGTTTKPATPTTPAKPAANSSKTTTAKPAASPTTKPAPVFMDANGKPLDKTTTTTKPATKPATKTTSKTTTPKVTTPAPDAASEKVKK